MTEKSERLLGELRRLAVRLPPGSRMPSVRALMERCEVSQLLVERAMRALKDEGLIVSRVGDGTYTAKGRGRKGASRLRTAALVMSQYPSSTLKAMADGFLEASQPAGFRLEIRYSKWGLPLWESLKGLDADAVIVHPETVPLDAESVLALERLSEPAVLVGCHLPMLDIDTVSTDDALGGMMAAEHLISLGHRKLAVLSAEPPQSVSSIRVDAFRKHCVLRGLPEPLLFDCGTRYGESSLDKAYVKAKQISASPLGFSALFITSDGSALGVAKAFHEAGIGIPSDVSLLGFDGIPEAAYYFPPLTTMRQDFRRWASESFAILAGRLESGFKGRGAATHVCVAPELIARASAGAVPSRFASSQPAFQRRQTIRQAHL